MLYIIKTITKIIIISFVLAVFLNCANDAFASKKRVAKDGVITAFRLNVRLGPSNDSSVYYVLKKNAKVKVYGETGTIGAWIQIEFDGQKGYVRNRLQYLRVLKPIKTIKPEPRTEKQNIVPNKDKASIKKKIQQKKEKIISFSKEEKIIIEGLNEIDSTLNQAKIKVSHISKNLKTIDKKIKNIIREKEKIIEEYDQKRLYSGTRLNALYRMKMLGKFEVVSAPESIFDFIIQQRALSKIIESDIVILNEQILTMHRYERLEKELKQNKKDKLELERELNLQILITEKKSKRKNEILKKIRTEKKLELAAIKSLEKAAIKLDQQIKQMSKLKKKKMNINSKLFSDYHGRLPMPVKGKIISSFGAGKSSDNKTFTFQNGIDIRPEKNGRVKAVFYGKVIFAKWFQGYGNLMIIDHGNSYYSLYAHNKELLKTIGDIVEKEEIIAIAGDTGSIKGLCLHFEIRHHGKPVNPMKWLRKGA